MPLIGGRDGLRTHRVNFLQLVERLVVQIRFINQAPACIGIVVSAVKPLLKAPA